MEKKIKKKKKEIDSSERKVVKWGVPWSDEFIISVPNTPHLIILC